MTALSITARRSCAANDIEDDVVAAELDWLHELLRDAKEPRYLTDPTSFQRFDAAWVRLARLAVALGMPENCADDAASWAEDYLRRNGRVVTPDRSSIVGTAEYRARHLALIWQGQLWHEVVMIVGGVGSVGLLLYALADGIR